MNYAATVSDSEFARMQAAKSEFIGGISWQIYRAGRWFHCFDHEVWHNHTGPRSQVSMLKPLFDTMIDSGELGLA